MDRNNNKAARTARPTTRPGVQHVGIRPHRVVTSSVPDLDKLIAAWAAKEGKDTFETYWGDKVRKQEEAARKHFAIPADQGVHLVFDTTILGSCKIGLALCDKGIYLRDEDKVQLDIPWSEFVQCSCDLDGDNLVIDGSRFISSDGRRLLPLLATIRKQLKG